MRRDRRRSADRTRNFSQLPWLQTPAVKAGHPLQQLFRGVRLLPVARNVLVGFGQRRVDVDRSEDLVQAHVCFS